MRKIIVFVGILLMCVTVWAQKPQTQSHLDPNMKKGVSRTGMARNGCDTARFVDRPGKYYELPKVDRRGQRLKFHLELMNKVLGCGVSDEEALLQITIHWQSDSSDFLPKIIERGVRYWYDPEHPAPHGEDPNAIFHKPDESLTDECSCDSTFYVLLDGLIPGTHYVTEAYVIKYSPNPSAEDTLTSDYTFITYERSTCKGWKPFDNEAMDVSGAIELVYDHEGNDYGVAQIGSQCWLRENVRCNTSPNGYLVKAPVTSVAGDTVTYMVSEQIPYSYRFDALTISYRQRGNLYNWIAVVDTFGEVPSLPLLKRRGLCPPGWHVPNTYEWYELVNGVLDLNGKTLADFHNNSVFYGDSVVKFSFGCGWPTEDPSGHAYTDANPGGYMADSTVYLRNTTHFSAMPSNNVQENGTLGYIKSGTQLTNVANYWLGTPSEKKSKEAYSWHIDEDQKGVSSFSRTRKRGFSLRCLRDALTITPSLNTPSICRFDQITYTPKVANEAMDDFQFEWIVINRDGEDPVLTSHEESFLFDPSDVEEDKKYKIVCHATRNRPDLPDMELWDSTFVDVVACGEFLSVTPKKEKYCVGETITISVQENDDELTNIRWSVNGGEEIAGGTTFSYTIPKNYSESTCMFRMKANSQATGDEIAPEIEINVTNALPSLAVCPNCDAEGFLIKSMKNIGHDSRARWCVSTAEGDSTVAYAQTVNTVVPAVPGLTYSVAMSSTNGCHDTIRGLVLTTPHFPCEPLNINLDNEILSDGKIDSVMDHEGNKYAVLQIGNRCWMKENMRAVTSPTKTNGKYDTIVPKNIPIGNTALLSNVSQVAHWYGNNPATNSRFGLLYNWCAATDTFKGTKVAVNGAPTGDTWTCDVAKDRRGICPEGWHLPTTEDWAEMESAVNCTGKALKLSGGCDWTAYDDNPNSPGYYVRSEGSEWASSGFNAIPSGTFSTTMQYLRTRARFWTSTQYSVANAYYRGLTYSSNTIERTSAAKYCGMSVRCVRNIPNWPPSMDVCYGVEPGRINIKTSMNLDSVAWCRSDGETFYAIMPNDDHVTLPPGKYAVKLFNNNYSSMYRQLDSITMNTACRVTSVNSAYERQNPYESGYIDSVKDDSNNWYAVVQIGGQCWMRTNMRTKVSNVGTPLSNGSSTCDQGVVNASISYYYDVCDLTEEQLPFKLRGYLYNWKAANEICPTGWHLPTWNEWDELYNNYPSKTAMLAGDCSKYWKDSYTNITKENTVGDYSVSNRNISGFSLVAAGNMQDKGKYDYTTKDDSPSANLWAAAPSGTARVVFDYNLNEMGKRPANGTYGTEQKRAFSVRCVRDSQ